MTLQTVAQAAPRAEDAVRRIELAVKHRLVGRLQGDHLGVSPGPGSELNDGRAYQPGDDVRRIDWSLSARSNQVQVRDTIADRELETWVVIDGSASMDFGTDQWQKRDLAASVATAYGFLSSNLGSRFATVIAEPGRVSIVPPMSSRDDVRRTALRLMNRPAAEPGQPDLAAAVEKIRRVGGHPGVVVLVSDLLGPPDWVRPLRGLSQQCRTIIADIRDPREDRLPDVGLLTVVDPETGRLREVQTSNRKFRAAYVEAAHAQRAATADAVRDANAEHLVIATDHEWINSLVRHHLTNRRTR